MFKSASSAADLFLKDQTLIENTIKAELLHVNFIVQHNLSFQTKTSSVLNETIVASLKEYLADQLSKELHGIPEKWDPGHGTSTGGTPDLKISWWDPGPGTPKVGPGTQDTRMFRCDLGPGTLKVGPGTQDPIIFKRNPRLPIFYSFNRLFDTQYHLEGFLVLDVPCRQNH